MAPQRSTDIRIEYQPSFAEILAEPLRLLLTQLRQAIVISAMKRSLRVPDQKKFCHLFHQFRIFPVRDERGQSVHIIDRIAQSYPAPELVGTP